MANSRSEHEIRLFHDTFDAELIKAKTLTLDQLQIRLNQLNNDSIKIDASIRAVRIAKQAKGS